MKYLIIGLGNPGSEYQQTRHNIGFKILDEFVSLSKSCFVDDKYAKVAEVSFKGRRLILIKPTTFMNLSGKAVRYWMQKNKIKLENILVITDDISLPLGVLRLRKKGSTGGHNGLKNIEMMLSSINYPRLRFGVGHDFQKGSQSEYVLSNFTTEDYAIIDNRIEMAIKIIQAFSIDTIDRVMSNFNGK